MRTIVLVAATLAALPSTSIDARADGAWCARDVKGETNCGFHTFEQCRLNLSGIGGTCDRNPNFPVTTDRARKPRAPEGR